MDSIISRLIRGAIQTGCFVTIFTIGNLIAASELFFVTFFIVTCNILYAVTSPSKNIYGMFAFPIGRLYTNVGVLLICRVVHHSK